MRNFGLGILALTGWLIGQTFTPTPDAIKAWNSMAAKPAADKLGYFTGDQTADTTGLTAAARTLLKLGAAGGDLLYASGTSTWALRNIGSAGDILRVSGGFPVWQSFATAGLPSGTGTANTVTKWTGTNTVGNSSITDDGSNVTLTTPLISPSRIVFDVGAGLIASNTSDGSDTRTVNISGGGGTAASNARGGSVRLHGNEEGSTGRAALVAGNVTGAQVALGTGGSDRLVVNHDGTGSYSGGVFSFNEAIAFASNGTSGQGRWLKTAAGGLVGRGVTASSYDLSIRAADDANLIQNPTGTYNLQFPRSTGTNTFSGPVVASSTLGITGVLTASNNVVMNGSDRALNMTGTGNFLSIGGTANQNAVIEIQSAHVGLVGSQQFGASLGNTINSSATSASGSAYLRIVPRTQAASFTLPLLDGVLIANPTIGSGSAVTVFNAIRIPALSSAGTNRAIKTDGAGRVEIGDVTEATSATSASVVLAGGIGVAGNSWFADSITVQKGVSGTFRAGLFRNSSAGHLQMTLSTSGVETGSAWHTYTNGTNSYSAGLWDSVGGKFWGLKSGSTVDEPEIRYDGTTFQFDRNTKHVDARSGYFGDECSITGNTETMTLACTGESGSTITMTDGAVDIVGTLATDNISNSGDATTANTFRFNGATATAVADGLINQSYTAVGNVGTGEDNLISYTLPASTLAGDGQAVVYEAGGTGANTVNAKTLKVYFGTQVVATRSLLTTAASTWSVRVVVIRTGAATQKAFATFSGRHAGTSGDDVTYTTPAMTLTGTQAIKCTGEATSNNDIVQEYMRVYFQPI